MKVFLLQCKHVFEILAARSSNPEPIAYDIFVVAGGDMPTLGTVVAQYNASTFTVELVMRTFA